MNEQQRKQAYIELEKYLEACTTKEQIDRGVQMAMEIEQKYIEYLEEVIEEVAPNYNMMDLEQITWTA